jgi:pyruvate/2-oxoglutarate dehydrogenase complex dihydrolipoamide dehydrogenase (E3) component
MTGCLWCSSEARAVELCQLLINAGYLVQASPADDGAAPFAFDGLYCVSEEDVGSPLGSPLAGQLLSTSRPGSATAGPAGSSRGAPSTARRDYSLIVIGAGPAGLAAALLASKLGARVALVDSRLPGGANVWSRHVPMRALAAAAKAAYAARSAGSMGVQTGGRVTVDMEQVRAHVARCQADIYRDHSPAALAAKGIEWVQGVAVFEDAHTLLVEATETPPGTALAAALVSPRSRASLLAGGSAERAVSPVSAAASPALTHPAWPSARPHAGGAAPVPPMHLAGAVASSSLPHAPASDGKAAEDALESIFEPEHAAAEQIALSARGGAAGDSITGATPSSPGLGDGSGSGQLSPASAGRPHASLGSAGPAGSAAALAGPSTFASPHLHAAPSAAAVSNPLGLRSPVAAAARSAVKTGKTRTLRGERILIAAGTSQRVPADIAGLEAVPYHTPETIFDSAFLPRRLVVVGGGPPACELAQAYSRLGSEVTIIAPALLPGEDDAVRAALRRVFFRERIQHAVGRAVRVEGTGRAPQASPFAAPPASAAAGYLGADGTAAGGLGGRSRAGSLAPTSPHSAATSPTSAPAAGSGLPGAPACLRGSPAAATARSLSPSTGPVPGLRLPSFPGRPVSPQPAQHLLASGAASAAALTGVVAGAVPSARARSGSIDAVSASAPIIVHTSHGDAYAADMLLVCGGREPALQTLGLARAGVALSSTRDGGCALRLSETLQTSAPHIYAAGGVTSDASCSAAGLARYASLPGGEEGEHDRTVTHGSVRLSVHHSRDSDAEAPAGAHTAAGGGAGEERGQHRHGEATGQHAAQQHASKHNPQAAAWEGFQAARHALLPGQAAAVPSPSPRVTCTEPAVASIGLTPAQALRHYGEGGVRVVTLDNEEAEPCRVDGDTHGFTSLAVLPDGRIAGATIVSARAADVASELALAMHTGATVQDIALTVHAHAGHASVLQEVAAAAATETFLRSSKAALAAAGRGGVGGNGVVGLRH